MNYIFIFIAFILIFFAAKFLAPAKPTDKPKASSLSAIERAFTPMDDATKKIKEMNEQQRQMLEQQKQMQQQRLGTYGQGMGQ